MGNIKSQALEIPTKNDTNIWMDKFPNVDIGFFSQNITSCTRVEPYNICTEYIINPSIGVSTIPNSTNIDVQDQIMRSHKFPSLFQKMIIECFIFDDVMYQKKQNPNEPTHLFITRSATISKTFTLMLLIEALIIFFNKHPHSNPFLKKKLFMEKKHLTLMELQFIQVFLYH